MFFEVHSEKKIGIKKLSLNDLGLKETGHQTHIGLYQHVLDFLPDNHVEKAAILIYDDYCEILNCDYGKISRSTGKIEAPNIKSGSRNDYIKWSVDCGNCKKMIGHKNVVRKRIATYLRRVDKKDILLKDVSKDEICGLFDYMRNKYRNKRQIKTNGGRLADYTLLLFEETVKAIFNKAMREGLVKFNPVHSLNKLERFHAPDKHREYLTPEELTRFLAVEAECENERTVQLAFGLSSMTALRLGDMQHRRWCDIKMIDGVPTISIIQRKTKRPAIIPLNEMAQSLLPPRTDDNPESLVFHLVKKSDNVSKYVRRLKEKAGIEKDLTYHCSRHTTASLAISAGADISAVKDVLGHGSITSTEVYAKVALEKKIEAVNLFNGVFD